MENLHVVRRIILAAVIIALLLFVQVIVFQIIIPPVTSDVGVKQVENSDQVFQELRATEVLKNSLATGFVIAYVGIPCLFLWKPAYIALCSLQDKKNVV